MKSFVTLALCLSVFFTFATARIPHSYRQLQERDERPSSPNAAVAWINRFFRRQGGTEPAVTSDNQPSQDVCYQDPYYNFVNGSAFGRSVCQGLGIKYPNRTIVSDFTPVETRTILTTIVETKQDLIRTTPITTVTRTVTADALAKRDAQITSAPQARDISYMERSDYIHAFRRQAENASALPEDDNVIAKSLTSACLCQTYIGDTVTETYTNQPDYVTLIGNVRSTTTEYSTRRAREETSTVTVTVPAQNTQAASSSIQPPASGAGATTSAGVPQGPSGTAEPTSTDDDDEDDDNEPTSTDDEDEPEPTDDEPTDTDDEPTATTSGSLPDATAPPFTCPDDDGQLISQMLGSERFDYDVFCDTDLPQSPDISEELRLSYASLAECVAACSYANAQFEQPVCQGAVFLGSTTDETNCFLKSGANVNDSVSKPGVDIAILRRIAVGIDENNAEGTNTENIPFSAATPTVDPAEIGSGIVAALGNSTLSMPIITPPAGYLVSGRPALNGVTAFSTYVSDGSTFSTGSAFSTYVSGNGSWYSAYYSTFSVAWSNAQTIYAAGETTFPVAYNNTDVTQDVGEDGESIVITKNNVTTIDDQGNQIVYNSTLITITKTIAGNGTELDASTSTDYYTYTQAVAGGASGGQGSSDGGALTASVSSWSTQTVIVNSGATVGGSGTAASGAIQTPPPVLTSTSSFSTQTVVLSSGGVGGEEGASGSGQGGQTAPTTSVTSTSAFSTQIVSSNSGGLGGQVGGGGSGAGGSTLPTIDTSGLVSSTAIVLSGSPSVNGTSGATGIVISGALSSTGIVGTAPIMSTFTDTTVIISTGGTNGAISTAASGAGSGGETSGETDTAASGVGTPSSSSRSFTFSNPSGNRTPGTESSTTLTGPSVGIPILNSSLSFPTGTSSGTFGAPSGPRNPGTERSSTMSGTGPAPYPPLKTPPPSNETNPAPTSSRTGTFSNSNRPRSGTDSSSTIPGTGPVPYPPLSTTPPSNASFPVPTGTAPSGSITTGPPSNSSLPVPTGTGPSGSITTGPPSNLTLSVPTGTAPGDLTSSSRSFTFNNPSGPRVGSDSTTSTRSSSSRRLLVQTLPVPPRASSSQTSTALSGGGPSNPTPSNSIPLSTGPPTNSTSPPFPTAPPLTSCASQTVSTTTLWMTTTLLGCFDQCPPKNGWGGGYGPPAHDGYNGPQTFGPPAAIFAPTLSGNPNPPQATSSAAETSS
ncbi:hypothetical protein Q7P37_000838 [Cladosporium fusiforme]